MSARNNGGFAFPVPDERGPNGEFVAGSNGMSLRDWFAGQALMGLIKFVPDDLMLPPKFTAEAAYAIADAMLTERTRSKGDAK